jgi:hypothetical protein
MGKEWMTLQGFDHGNDSIMATNPKIVSLGDVMGQDNSGGGSNSGKHSQ